MDDEREEGKKPYGELAKDRAINFGQNKLQDRIRNNAEKKVPEKLGTAGKEGAQKAGGQTAGAVATEGTKATTAQALKGAAGTGVKEALLTVAAPIIPAILVVLAVLLLIGGFIVLISTVCSLFLPSIDMQGVNLKPGETIEETNTGTDITTTYSKLSPEQKKAIEEAIEGQNGNRSNIVNVAASVIGKIPYLWGGKPSKPGFDHSWGTTMRDGKKKGLDCSGFVQWVYWTAGYNKRIYSQLGSTSAIRTTQIPISKSQLKPGDLGIMNDGSSTNHTGIYVGNGYFIHCNSGENNVSMDKVTYFKYFYRVGGVESEKTNPSDLGSISSLERTGYDDISDALVPYYERFNQKISKLIQSVDEYNIVYENEESNFKDIIRVYAVKASQGEAAVPTMISMEVHKKELKNIFEKMMYEKHSIRKRTYTEKVEENGREVEKQFTKRVADIHIYNFSEEQYITKYGFSKAEQEMFDLYNAEGLKELFDMVFGNNDIGVIYSGGNSSNIKYDKPLDLSDFDFSTIPNLPPTCSNMEYIDILGKAAIALYDKYPVLPSITIAQAIQEGGWRNSNQSQLARKHYNFFGMKWWEGCGYDYVSYKTGEQNKDGGYYTVYAKFISFNSFSEGMVGRMEFLRRNEKRHYNGIMGETDFDKALDILVKGGYATSLNYWNAIKNLYIRYDLKRYDDAIINQS